MQGAFRNPDKSAFAQTWINGCERIIAVAECYLNRDYSGNARIETRSFSKDDSLDTVLNWAHSINCNGNIRICPDEATMRQYKDGV